MATKNIYNPSTGQYGYQIPGTALPAGWQWVSGGTSTPTATPSVTPSTTSTPKPSTTSTPTSTPSVTPTSQWITFQGTQYNLATPEGMAAYQSAINKSASTPAPASTPTPTPSTPAPTTTPAAGTTPEATPQPSSISPSVYLEPGMTGDDVKKLQDYLVSQGLMTREQVNTGYGIYGPQTTAAVKALQEKLGVDNSSGVGYFGPRTIAAIQGKANSSVAPADGIGEYKGVKINPGTEEEIRAQMEKIDSGAITKDNSPAYTGEPAPSDTGTGKTPIQNVMDAWTKVSEQLGLSSIKQQYEKTLKDQEAMMNEKAEAAAEINNNPWYSEGKRQAELKKLDGKYETKLNTLSNFAKLYEALYEEGVSQAKYLVGEIQDESAKVMEIAQKKQDALNALSKENQVVSVNGHEVLVNKATGKIVADLGKSSKTATAQGAEKTYRSGGLVYADTDIAEGQDKLEVSRGSDGWVDPSVYLRMYQIWTQNGGLLQDFLSKYPPKNYVNPKNEWLPDYLMPAGARKSDEIDNPFD